MSDLLMKLFMIALYLFEGVFIQRLFQTFAQPRWSTGKWSEYVVSMIWVMYRDNPKFCVTAKSGANREKFIMGGRRVKRLPPC